MSFTDRVRSFMFKATTPGDVTATEWSPPSSKEELEAAVKSADDKERAIGLIAAPLAAIVALLTAGSLIANDPPKFLSSGALNPKHYTTAPYEELRFVLIIMAVLILASAWYRKRAVLAITLALFGLGVFNLHFWGFGVPFILAGSWLLVRTWRLTHELKMAGGGKVRASATDTGGAARPRVSKRYTPPGTSRRRW
jgi:hypothetical protein